MADAGESRGPANGEARQGDRERKQQGGGEEERPGERVPAKAGIEAGPVEGGGGVDLTAATGRR